MSKPIVEILHHAGNQLRVYYEVKSEEDELNFANVMNKLPVVSYSKAAGCNFVSLYHFEKMVQLLEKKGFEVCVEKGLVARHRRLLKIISTNFREPLGERLSLWSDKEDRRILPYQIEGIEKSLGRLRYIIADDMGIGKELVNGTLVLAHRGWKKVEDMVVGEKIYGRDGKLHTVTGVYPQGLKDIYRVVLSDNTSLNVGLKHLWTVRDGNSRRRTGQWRVLNTGEIKKTIRLKNGLTRWEIPLVEPIQFDKKDLVIPPYVLGVLIADGSLTTGLTFVPGDLEVPQIVKGYLNSDYDLHVGADYGTSTRFGITYRKKGKNPWYAYIKEVGLNVTSEKKYIPHEYLYGSVEQRKELLAGLLDCDGSINGVRVRYGTASQCLADDVANLVRSLGGVATISISKGKFRTDGKRNCQELDMYVVNVRVAFNPAYRPSRKNKWKVSSKLIRQISSIDFIEKNHATCISVNSPDNLYVAENYVVTHNTIEALGIILKAFEMGYSRALIVCFVSQKRQWLNEILKFTKLQEKDILILGENKNLCDKVQKFAKSSKICKTCDMFEKCKDICSSVKKLRKHQLLKQKDKRIVIANYETVRGNVDQVINADFDIHVVDEVSKLKNYNSGVTRAFMKISRQFAADDIFIPMSGTLIENRVQEFYPVFSMLDSQIFGTWSNFKSYYLVTDFWGKPIGVRHEDELRDITKKFFIRRSVEEVWHDRPELFEINKYCEMSPIQRKIYNDVLNSKVDELKESVSGKINNAQLAVLINYLIMVADTAEVVKALGKHKADDYSCKIEYLKEMLIDEFSGKAIIFCKYANKVIPVIKRELDKLKITNVVITGSVPVKVRQELLEKFAKSKDRILICSDAMSYGMNLQFVNTVINFDLPWNPAILDQRIRRVYRKGQKKNVNVFNLIVADSAESLVLEKIYTKRDMFEKYIGKSIKAKSVLNGISLGDIWHEE